MKPASLKTQISSGGVLFRKNCGGTEVALVSLKGGTVWSLPKGLIDKGESPEDTAVREVREETGMSGRIVGKIGDISYWYFIKGENKKCKKTVHFFLMEYTGGSPEAHDREVDNAAWIGIDAAADTLNYKGDRQIIEKARRMLSDSGTCAR